MNETTTGGRSTSIAAGLADFVVRLDTARLPPGVWEKSIDHIVDSIGMAFAAHRFPFVAKGIAGISAAGASGDSTVIGSRTTLAPRDAALANGFLIHGLDFDDTHPSAIVHPSAACLPTALALAEALDKSWGDLVTAYAAGMEAAVRLGQSVNGGFHHAGFHATGVVSHFSAALIAGRLLGLTADQLVSAQGIAASTASGVQVFLEDGAWTKRMHPGWGALAGTTAAQMAQAGFAGPRRPYEGRFGLFDTHIQTHSDRIDIASITDGLGDRWSMLQTSIKPYPICHFIHGCAEAAINLRSEIGDASRIEQITCELPQPTMPIVAEPRASKIVPRSDYEAKFSAQFVVAACLLRGRFGLSDLDDQSLADPEILALAARTNCVAATDSSFPKYFPGTVSVRFADGSVRTQSVPVNLGSGERALTRAQILAKFRDNACIDAGSSRFDELLELLLTARPEKPARSIARALALPSSSRP